VIYNYPFSPFLRAGEGSTVPVEWAEPPQLARGGGGSGISDRRMGSGARYSTMGGIYPNTWRKHRKEGKGRW